MPRVQPETLRATLVALYGEANVRKLEAAPAPVDEPAAELAVIRDAAEAARFAAEVERDAALGSHADWPNL